MNLVKPSVYVETSVISYYTASPSRDLIIAAHQQITQEWWKMALNKYEVFISPVVLEEIARGDQNAAENRLKVIQNFSVLDVVPQVKDLAEEYFLAIGIPEKAKADAYHLAVAAWHGMDFVSSWNCKHIASGRVKSIVYDINSLRSIKTPFICTPEELMEV